MEEDKKKSWAALLVEVIFSPGESLKYIVENPRFGAAAVTLSVIGLISTAFTIPKVQEFSLWTLENTPGISPEDIEALGAFTGNVTVGTTIVAAIAAPWVFGLVMAVLMKIYAAISSKEAPFGTLFAVGIYGYVPALLGTIITNILLMLTAVENFTKANLSLAVFAPTESGFLYGFLSACNPFIWWSLILCSIGGALVMKNKNSTWVMVYLFGLWLVYAIIAGLIVSNAPAL
ncbi:MAG TPA: GTPase [Peptococcaceae bacterium]|nr:GTPase [Peptococcaceae bacterium]